MRPDAPGPSPAQEPTEGGILTPGTILVGRLRFRLDRFIGGGSFGAVYASTCLDAVSAGIPETVAVKILTVGLTDRQRRHALQRELSSMLAVRCRRIPRVFDWKLDGSRPFIAMEYFGHGTLEDLVEASGPVDEGVALALFVSLLEALVAAHSSSVLHLDIKPANVLLDGNGMFVLADFGISQAPRSGNDLPMPGLGSEGWQSPEQEEQRRSAFDLRTDLFGVGVTMWSALTGIDLATRRGQVHRQRARASTIVLPPVSVIRRGPLNPDLEQLVMALLAREPTLRPGDPSQVLERVIGLRDGTVTAEIVLPGSATPPDEVDAVLARVVDPLVARLFEKERTGIRKVRDGAVLCHQDERSHHAFVLISGAVRIRRDGEDVARVDREGEFLGEIAALTGEPRNASMVADGDVWIRVLNAAQLESVVASNPALGVRMIRSMANRFKYIR